MFLVVGLGNPGAKYSQHRHNVGFMVVDAVASRLGAEAFRDKFSAQVAKAEAPGAQLVLLKPQTFMNESGRSVQPAAAFFKVPPERVLVVHDELDLPWRTLRLKVGGGHAGHNGLRSLIAHLGTGDFGRLRVGIGRPPPGFAGEVADYVLSGFDAVERAELDEVLKLAVESVLDVAFRGLGPAMNERNTREGAGRKGSKPNPKINPKTKGADGS